MKDKIRWFIIGFITVLMLQGTQVKCTDDFGQHFGYRMVKAFALVVLDEINILRVKVGLPERTKRQLLTAVQNKWNVAGNDTTAIWLPPDSTGQ